MSLDKRELSINHCKIKLSLSLQNVKLGACQSLHLERTEIKSLLAGLTVKRIPDSLIINEVFKKTGKTISTMGLYQHKTSN
jgi:hypothetical protein